MSLAGKIALVTGASRGIGRGIAVELGRAGATVYVTGRAPEDAADSGIDGTSLQATADQIREVGGICKAIYVDHGKPDEVKNLFSKIAADEGRLDILVNNAYAGVNFIFENVGKKFYEMETPPEYDFDIINNVGLRNHYVCSVLAARIMVHQRAGLIVNIGSVGGASYLFNIPYGLGKAAIDRLSSDAAIELQGTGVHVMSLWPGPVRTETIEKQVLTNDKVMAPVQEIFADNESIYFSGKCIVALYNSKNWAEWNGKILTTHQLSNKFKLVDVDGSELPRILEYRLRLAVPPPHCNEEDYAEYIRSHNKIRTRHLKANAFKC